MSRKQSVYTPRIDCQHRVGQADGTSRIITFSRVHGDTLKVNRGVIVPKHFNPLDANAKEDRQNQLDNPAEYVKSAPDLNMLAEILVQDKWAKDLDEAQAIIMEDIEGVETLADLDEQEADKAMDKVCAEYTVEQMKKLLKEEGVAFHGRAKERSLAAKLIEHDLA